MSVLIKGMEMPTAGMCKTITIFDDGAVVEGNGSEKLGIAVPVQPHGRLIDADALRAEVKKHNTPSDAWVFSLIRTAPTVIEAEEGE